MKSLDSIVAANAAVQPGYGGASASYLEQQERGNLDAWNYKAQLIMLRNAVRVSRMGLASPVCSYCGRDERQAKLCNDPLCTME